MPTLKERFTGYRLLLDEGIDPNELAPEDLESLLKTEAYESFITNAETFWHRGQEYIIGEEISLEAAQMVCRAQWADRDDRLQFAHALFTQAYVEDAINANT